ncbi:MAG TPA: alanine--tRNA ligase, partial [Thermoflexales bacterium]|nr:alanine--tRNA ligase [Thermoflexales bacterium]
MMQSEAIRRTFLDYFARQGHTVLPSSSLIPYGDNTILFTNAGMNQFKNAFLGLEKRPYVRAATAQKVMRVSGKHNDLENVGPSRRHHTFFEMLGNFSFGDYFKEDAMKYALELMEGEYGFERERLWFTIYKDDDQSYDLWQKVGIKANRILRFGEKDNFWSMGPTGPCGPNSEIHYFTGKLQDNDPKWVNNDDDPNETTVEVWNLVFMQFNRTEDGVLHPLPQTGVDTGMGFERLCRLIEGGESNYDTDLFMPIMDKVQQLAGQTNAARKEQFVAYRVIADHVRAATFLIGDGVLPGNEGRNYVLRMVMRRAMRYGRDLGFEAPFLYQTAEAVIDKMGGYYTELLNRREHILKTIHAEEERFERTLDQGLERLNEALAQTESKELNGEAAFKLYDTYGMPLEITRD